MTKIHLLTLFIAAAACLAGGCSFSANPSPSADLSSPANPSASADSSSPANPSPSAAETDEAAAYRKITAEEAQAMMADGEAFLLLDVRTEAEFDEMRIDGAVLIPDYEIAARAAAELTDQNARILLYCRSGRRSAGAAQELADMGYTNVYDLGGIIDWPYETVGTLGNAVN